ncbi:hypothetical protein AAZX31_13G249400 [Glycine max]
MALSSVSSMDVPPMQTSNSSDQKPTTMIIEWACICDNSDEIGEGGREESDLHNPGKGTDTKTNIRPSGQENSTIDENISCACVIDEEVTEKEEKEEEAGKEEKEKTVVHDPGKGTDPKTNIVEQENSRINNDPQIDGKNYCSSVQGEKEKKGENTEKEETEKSKTYNHSCSLQNANIIQ